MRTPPPKQSNADRIVFVVHVIFSLEIPNLDTTASGIIPSRLDTMPSTAIDIIFASTRPIVTAAASAAATDDLFNNLGLHIN